MNDGLTFGVSYYPELLEHEQWDHDLELMSEAGLKVVRVLEFAWAQLEPREGQYEWAWADRFLDRCDSHGLRVVICTPTATPPTWLLRQYPDVMVTLREGGRRTIGSRRDLDPCHPIYRDFSERIAGLMARRWGGRDTLIGWQIDNELIGPELAPPETHSAMAQWRFRRWLRQKYRDDLEALNEAWFLGFWSQRFSDWGEVLTPVHERVTRGWALDYAAFFSDMLGDYARLQYDAIRPHAAAEQWITTNATAMVDRGIDHAAIARRLDVAGWDAYPGAASAGRGHHDAYTAMCCDWLRCATGKPVKILETVVGPTQIDADYLRMLHRHGVDLVLFWHWRQHRGNVEQNSEPVCDYEGKPYADCLDFIKQITRDPTLVGCGAPDLSRRDTAMLLDIHNQRWHLHRDPHHAAPTYDYARAAGHTYAGLREAGVSLDVIDWAAALDDYQLLVVPSPRLMDREQAERLMAYVRGGGRLILTGKACAMSRTGVYHAPPGGPLSAMLGVTGRDESRVTETQPARRDQARVEFDPWIDVLEEPWEPDAGEPAEVLARFIGGIAEGRPALLHRRHGSGEVWYLAGPCKELLLDLIAGPLAKSNT